MTALDLRRFSGTMERLSAAAIVALVAGSVAAFGGRVWWAPPAAAALCLGLVALGLARGLLAGSLRVFRSPLTGLGLLALGLALAQLAPLPAAAVRRVSPSSRSAYALGFLPGPARTIDPGYEAPEGPAVRAPVSVDRPATLRWLAGASACLAVFWGVSGYADRLGRLLVVWGSVVGAFGLNAAVALVQLACGSRGLYGFIEPGRGPAWAPDYNDLLAGPNASVLRASAGAGAAAATAGHPSWAWAVPDRPFFVGTQMGGPGAFLALGSLALPLALALALQLLAPRGSREPLPGRLGGSGQGGLFAVLCGVVVAGSALIGLLAGPWFCLPTAAGLAIAGLPGAWSAGLRWSALGLTALALSSLGGGVAAGRAWSASASAEWPPPPVEPPDFRDSARVWKDSLAIARDFPVLGSGLGTFATVYPHYKTRDAAPTTARSSLVQWGVEAGGVGMGLLALGLAWALAGLPGAVRRVGTADRCLAFGLIGAAAAFTLFSAVHWTVELPSVALAASALGGVGNRWLAGGTDLFVERG